MMSDLAVFGGNKSVKQKLLPFNAIGKEEWDACHKVLDQGLLSGFHGSPRSTFFGGTQVCRFEGLWQDRFGVKHAISVNSATSALIAAMGAIGISPGDEVIVPPYTMSATAMAPLFYGGIPVFVDIEPQTYCIDVALVRQAITSRTKAIIAVNLFGHPAELKALKRLAIEHDIFLIEDNAQAILATEDQQLTGTIGHIGIFSLNIHKHIQTGEGGMLVTNDDDLALRLKLIRNHGENVIDWLEIENITNLIGYNFRLPEMAAAMGCAQLEKLDDLVERCQSIGRGLCEGLQGLPHLTVPQTRADCSHSYFMWTAALDDIAQNHRAWIVDALVAEGIPVSAGYVCPLYRLPVFKKKIAIGHSGYPFNLSKVSYEPSQFPVVEKCHYQSVIQIQPVAWQLESSQLRQVNDGFQKVFEHVSELKEQAVVC